MKKILILFFPLLLIAQVKRLHYIDHYNRPMTTYKEWLRQTRKEPFSIERAYHSQSNQTRQGLVDVVVFAPLYPGIQDSLNIYLSDLESEGYTVQVDTIRGWAADSLRLHLSTLLDSGLVGAVFIGEVPFAWYEMTSADGREEFPIDLYLMDLDGTWTDSDGNGLFDGHSGNKAPEIWTGRIYASSMTWGNEVYLVNNYLSKLHRYRTGGYNIPQKALAYVDDDWYSFYDCSLGLLYDTVDVIRQYNTTVASDFRMRLNDAYEWVQICSHSSPWGNTFKYSGGYAGTVFNFEIWFANPPFLFLNLFQCSGTRFFEENYTAGCYIFGPENGLLSVGSSKVGSMLHFSDFYGPMNNDYSVGEAFKQWFTQWGITDPSWFYGMIICGDPTLKPKQSAKRLTAGFPHSSGIKSLYSWTTPEPVDLDDETDGYVSTTSDGNGRIWAAWVTGRSQSNGRTEICVAYHQNGVWSSTQIIDPYLYWDFFPAMTRDSAGQAVLAWSRCFGRNYDIYFTRYNGSNWITPYRVSSKATDALHPAMTTDGDNRLWVTMERWNHLNGDIYCRYYDDSGWQSMFAVTIDSANDYAPRMATDSAGRAWTVWSSERYQDNRNIYVKRYNPSSGHWENIYRVTGNPVQDQDPRICVDGNGTIWVTWTTWRNGNADIYESHYDGVSWSSPQAITSDENNDEYSELVVDKDGYVWCIWQSDRNGDWEILSRYYKDGAWQDLACISNSSYQDILPATTLDDSGNIWVLWQTDRNGNWDIYASKIHSDLIPPQVTVIKPNGGEVWNIGEFDTIVWTATDNSSIDSLSIYYSTDGGGTWLPIANNLPNDTSYIWQVPATPSTECLVKVVAFDPFPNSGEDISDALFEIHDAEPPQVILYAPNGGEIFYTEEIDTIYWYAIDNIGLDSISVEFSSDSGTTWTTIASPPPSDTFYEWTVPSVYSSACLIRIQAFDGSGNQAEDISDSLFSIVDNIPPEVSVIIPNGGEVWYWNEVHTIRWYSWDNVGIDSLNIELSLDGGQTYPLLIAHIDGNDSTYNWAVPETTSYECLIKISAYDPAGNRDFDLSDSLFTIGVEGIMEQKIIPDKFAIGFISTNPFSDRFGFRLQIPEDMSVRISAYDVQGRHIEDILNAELKPGCYKKFWQNSELPAGIYFIQIRAGEYRCVEKIIKLK